ncbi:protein numb-like isoform X2 [Patiria miniata]|uniref:PID domain-containing protein n=1 Tax=Patiria miniata TaxID=46514 RepID=A0A914B7H9_PATMI|nr:protein numb-like isoform X2 [Patiria miniata]
MGRLKSFFFGSSHGRHKYNKNPPPDTGPASPGPSAEANPSSSTSQSPASTPKRNSRLRRSLSMKKLRSSFRRKEHAHVPAASKPHQWQQDEKLVRAGSCNFPVKYLGSIEVTESRGMHICEDAAKQLRANTKKKVRAILWVSSDGLRVVDEESKGLIVDQTIEKVSFCAPDRHNDKGFSYICRDGTTRRWLCHCFHSLREPGERLSHAVGCAFAACLERKQQRDKLCGVKVEFDVNKTSFTRQGSFRQATMTEQMEEAAAREDEKENQEQDLAGPAPNMPFARPRQHASEAMLMRQGSFRGFPNLNIQSPFKRQLSLRLNELPSTLQRQQNVLHTHPETSPLGTPTSPTASTSFPQQQQQQQQRPVPQQQQQSFLKQQQQQPSQVVSISAACQELSDGLFELSSKEGYPAQPAQLQQQQPQVRNVMPPAAGAIPAQPTTALQQHPVPQQPMVTTRHPMATQQVLAQPETNPWAPPPQPQVGPNPWDPASAQMAGPNGISQAEKWLKQTSQTVSTPYGVPAKPPGLGPAGEQRMGPNAAAVSPVQNGYSSVSHHHQGIHLQNATYEAQPMAQVPAGNFNNSATAPVYIPNRPQQQQQPVTAGGNVGISGGWTSDLSRTLPDSGAQAGTTNGYSSSFEARWESLPSNQTPVMANNPFANATKAFEINL